MLTAFLETISLTSNFIQFVLSQVVSPAQFPVLGTATAAYHSVGTPLVGANQIKANEKIINIDDLLIAQSFVAKLMSLKNHYDVRATYADELGKALAKQYDINVAKVIANASQSFTNLSGGNGGLVLTLANTIQTLLL